MTSTLTVSHPTNGHYNTTYGYFLKNTATKQEILIFWSRKATVRELWEAARDAADFLKANTTVEQLIGVKKGKGSSAYLEVAATDWIITRGYTKRELHGKTLEYLAIS